MERAFEQLRQQNRPYQVLVMLSGGKDSAYVLHLMKNTYKLRAIALQVVHPFVNELSLGNAVDVARALNVDLIQFNVDEGVWQRALSFAYHKGEEYGAGEMYGCGVCSTLYQTIGMKLALHLGVGCVIGGYDRALDVNPILTDPRIVKTVCLEGLERDSIKRLIHDAMAERHAGTIYDTDFSLYARSQFPGRVAPLTVLEHDHADIVAELDQMGLLPKARSRSDDTNCDLFHLLSYLGYQRYQTHPYVRLIAQAMRENRTTYFDQWLTSGSRHMGRGETLQMFDEYARGLSFAAAHPDADESKLVDFSRQLTGMLDVMGQEQLLKALKRATRMKELAEYVGLDWSEVVANDRSAPTGKRTSDHLPSSRGSALP